MEENRLGYRHFQLLWFGQFVSNFGTAVGSFAVGVWVYQQTGSVSKLSFTMLSATLPGVLSAPLIGSLIDRHDRRLVLILSNLGSLLGIGLLVALFEVAEPGLATICLLLAVVTVFRTAQWPTFGALITLLVPQERLGKANGLVELGRSFSAIGAPILAGFLLTQLEISKILTIDVLTYVVALLILWRLSFRDVAGEKKHRRKTPAGEAWEGFLYVWERTGLRTLMILYSAMNLLISILQVIVRPFVLDMATAQDLGLVMGIGGAGMMLGGLAVSARGVPQRKIPWTLSLLAFQGAGLIVAGLVPGLITVTLAIAVIMTTFPFLSSMNQVIWQTKVERSYHGRIFAIRQMILNATVPVGYLLSGPLADLFTAHLEPFASSLGGGSDLPAEARGISLLFLVLGALTLLFVLVAARRKALHELDES